jgi:hypothetical protein
LVKNLYAETVPATNSDRYISPSWPRTTPLA